MTAIHSKSTLEKVLVSYGVLVYACPKQGRVF